MSAGIFELSVEMVKKLVDVQRLNALEISIEVKASKTVKVSVSARAEEAGKKSRDKTLWRKTGREDVRNIAFEKCGYQGSAVKAEEERREVGIENQRERHRDTGGAGEQTDLPQ